MDTFLTGSKRISEAATHPLSVQSKQSKAKTRKYDKGYLSFGFTSTEVGGEERPVCMVCLKTLAADSMTWQTETINN